MSSVIQSGNAAFSNGSAGTTATVTLTGVAAGNSIMVKIMGSGHGNGTTVQHCTVSDGTSYTAAVQNDIINTLTNNDTVMADIFFLHNASAGTHGVVATNGAGAFNAFGNMEVCEVSGLQQIAPDKTGTGGVGGGTTTPTVSASGADSQANEMVFACMAGQGSSGSEAITTPATTGYTSLFVQQSSVNVCGESSYKHVTAIGTQTGAWGTINHSIPVSTALAAFKDVGAVTGVGGLLLLGLG